MTTPKQAPLDRLKAQLAQLDQLAAEGVLTGEAARQARADLEQQIVKLVTGQATPAPAATSMPAEVPVRAPRKLVLALAAFVLVFGMAGWGFMGNRAGLQVGPGERGPEVAASPAEQDAQVQAMVAKLEERLKTQPDDVEGWQMMARSYNVMGRHADAMQTRQIH